MTVVGTIRTELVYSRPSTNGPASAIVPLDRFAALDAEKNRLGCATQWWQATDPHTGVNRPAFTPLAEGRIELIERQGIRHGERFVATIDIKEVTRNSTTQRQMWLVDAQALSALITEVVSSIGTTRKRDPSRISRILERIKRIWMASPDLRMGQLLNNVCPKLESNLFNTEDTEVEAALERYEQQQERSGKQP